LDAVRRQRPAEVQEVRVLPHPELSQAPEVPSGHFDLGERLGNTAKPFRSFSGFAKPDVLLPGTRLVRVVDPGSWDNSPFWMLEDEFLKLRSKSEWRARFAVWGKWNGNGEYVVYEVPRGPGLQVWRGPVASQNLTDAAGRPIVSEAGLEYCLPGGAEQIVLRPQDLDAAHLSKRMKTGWAYADTESDDILRPVGVPALINFWGPEKL
jgi:hypothetical protein